MSAGSGVPLLQGDAAAGGLAGAGCYDFSIVDIVSGDRKRVPSIPPVIQEPYRQTVGTLDIEYLDFRLGQLASPEEEDWYERTQQREYGEVSCEEEESGREDAITRQLHEFY